MNTQERVEEIVAEFVHYAHEPNSIDRLRTALTQALQEQAERQAAVVRGMRKEYETGTPFQPDFDDAYNAALDDVLTALKP